MLIPSLNNSIANGDRESIILNIQDYISFANKSKSKIRLSPSENDALMYLMHVGMKGSINDRDIKHLSFYFEKDIPSLEKKMKDSLIEFKSLEDRKRDRESFLEEWDEDVKVKLLSNIVPQEAISSEDDEWDYGLGEIKLYELNSGEFIYISYTSFIIYETKEDYEIQLTGADEDKYQCTYYEAEEAFANRENISGNLIHNNKLSQMPIPYLSLINGKFEIDLNEKTREDFIHDMTMSAFFAIPENIEKGLEQYNLEADYLPIDFNVAHLKDKYGLDFSSAHTIVDKVFTQIDIKEYQEELITEYQRLIAFQESIVSEEAAGLNEDGSEISPLASLKI